MPEVQISIMKYIYTAIVYRNLVSELGQENFHLEISIKYRVEITKLLILLLLPVNNERASLQFCSLNIVLY